MGHHLVGSEHVPTNLLRLQLQLLVDGPEASRATTIAPANAGSSLAMNLLLWLVVLTPLKNMNVNWDDYSQYMGK